jgi:AbrB family looped-hinge helix DNA binding protein
MGASEHRRVDEKGRVTLPQSIRESLGIEAGEEVTVELDDGEVVIRPQVTREAFVEQMAGCIDGNTRAESVEPTDPRELKADWTSDL